MPLGARNLQPELMDAPDLDPASHARASAPCAGSTCSAGPRRRCGRPCAGRRTARATGRCACWTWPAAAATWRWASGGAQREKLALEIVGLDMSPVAVARARSLAEEEQANVEFRVGNVLDEPLPADFDAIVTSLFLHHLTWDQAVGLLAGMSHAARRLVVVSDLRRSTAGYLLAQATCRLVTRSPIVHVDGPRSVAGAFTLSEVRQMCVQADLTPIKLTRSWPCRFLLSWERA